MTAATIWAISRVRFGPIVPNITAVSMTPAADAESPIAAATP